VDDGSPVDISGWIRVGSEAKRLFDNSFTRQFGQLCQAHGVRGKFSVLPMPAGLGRIDEGLVGVPAAHLAGFLRIVRQLIAPNFDITPEFLTHGATVDIATGMFRHIYEDVWADQADVAEMTDYFSFAMRILNNVGLPATGVTSPWQAGENNEKRYAEAIARAVRRVYRRSFAWYFLHGCRSGQPRWPWVTWRNRRRGMVCVSVATNTRDVYWQTLAHRSARAVRQAAMDGIDTLLSRDGKQGRLREVFEARCPLIMLAHWQCLYTNGRCAGLGGFEHLLERIEKVFGDQVRWMRCSDIAKMSLKRPRRPQT
jgi:hypothetical protein